MKPARSREHGAYRLLKAPETLQIPATAQAILAARIDRLAPEAKRLLQTAALLNDLDAFYLDTKNSGGIGSGVTGSP